MLILSTAHNLGDARLHRISAALARAGVRHHVAAVGDASFGPRGSEVIHADPNASALARARRATIGTWRRAGLLIVLDPDAVPVSLLATRVRRTPLVVDIHEDYEKVAEDRPWARGLLVPLAKRAARLITQLAARAELTVVADEHLPPMQARRRIVVRNLPRSGEISIGSRRDNRPRAIYIGDIRPSRGLASMLDAVADAPGWELDLVGRLSGVSAEAVASRLARNGLQERVRLHGRLPPDRAWALADGAWCGLSLLTDTPAYREAVPTKLYEYLAAGLPIVSSDLPRSRGFVESTGAGRLAKDAHEAATILRSWAAEPSERDLLAEEARRWTTSHLDASSGFDALASEIAALIEPNQRSESP